MVLRNLLLNTYPHLLQLPSVLLVQQDSLFLYANQLVLEISTPNRLHPLIFWLNAKLVDTQTTVIGQQLTGIQEDFYLSTTKEFQLSSEMKLTPKPPAIQLMQHRTGYFLLVLVLFVLVMNQKSSILNQ